jgi:glycosyltransferase involved in cell wall biosynthesis
MGKAHNERNDAKLRKKYSKIPNLKMTGFVSEEEKSMILEKSWALINTSIREALPVSFLEALAHETPIISGEDPDQLTSIFGYKVVKDNFSATLEELFQSDERIDKGKQGREHMKKVYDVDKVVHQHIQEYRKLLEV